MPTPLISKGISAVQYLELQISEIKKRLAEVEKRIREFEQKYSVSTEEFRKMLKGELEWSLPDDADLDVIEWEALLLEREYLQERLRELNDAWRALRGSP